MPPLGLLSRSTASHPHPPSQAHSCLLNQPRVSAIIRLFSSTSDAQKSTGWSEKKKFTLLSAQS